MNGVFIFFIACAWSTGVLVLDGKAARQLWRQFESGHYPVTYLGQSRKINSGEDDLILDETSTTITLPETYGRNERAIVNRSEIDKLTVEQIEHRGSKGGVSYTYAPTLWLRRNENVETQKLADWGDRKKAEAFAEWLRHKLNLAERVGVVD